MQKLTIVIGMLVCATTAGAQRLADTRPAGVVPKSLHAEPIRPTAAAIPAYDDGTGRMMGTGMLFAVGGIFAGAVAGAELSCANADPDDWCELGGGLLGATIGEVVMLPLGVHIASDRSSYGRKLAVSSGVLLVGIALAPVTGGISLLATPPVQLLAVVGAERAAIRKGAQSR